jgi:hypothetical protein
MSYPTRPHSEKTLAWLYVASGGDPKDKVRMTKFITMMQNFMWDQIKRKDELLAMPSDFNLLQKIRKPKS